MRKLVIVDDELFTINGIKVMMEKLETGYEVAGSACDGFSALSLIRSVQPDLVITDIKMPGMTGLELIEQLKPEFPDMVFVLISGYREFEYARHGLELGVNNYIDKPITREKLQKLLEKVDEELDKRTVLSHVTARKNILKELRLSRDILIEKIHNNNDKGWKDEIESGLKLLKDSRIDLDDYKSYCYQLVVTASEVFYEKWKQYEKTYNFPLYQNIEKLSSAEEVDEYVYLIMENLFQKIAVRQIGSAHRSISEILDYINENYSKDFGLYEMAEMVRMNHTYLSILFRDEVGTSFIKYLTRVRIEHAKELLLKGYKVFEVSEMVGYNNYRYFCNIFKKEEGETPMEFKGNIRRKDS